MDFFKNIFSAQWFADHYIVVWLLIFVMISFIYKKVFQPGKITISKALVVYGVLAISSFFLALFQADFPILQCMAIAIGLMLLVKVRYFFEKKQQKSRQ